MKQAIILFVLLLFSLSCTRETYETRLEIQNNLDFQVNCAIYPKSGYYISCDTISYLSQQGGFESFYAVGQSKSPESTLSAVIDSIRISFLNPSDNSQVVLSFNKLQSVNYFANPFTDNTAWKIENSTSSHSSSSGKLHMQTCIFAINSESIITAAK